MANHHRHYMNKDITQLTINYLRKHPLLDDTDNIMWPKIKMGSNVKCIQIYYGYSAMRANVYFKFKRPDTWKV